jgi:hypothetical protein
MNRIHQVVVRNRVLDPVSSEICITVIPEQPTRAAEIRGRLMGPSCPYATTVEVAYPLRPILDRTADFPDLSRRVLIPEASFWDPVSPFLYQGPVELWEGDHCHDRVQVRHGLRVLTLSPAGLRFNGRPLALRGVQRNRCPEDEAIALHRAGVILLLAPATPANADLWDVADRFGFLLLGRLGDTDDEALHLAATNWCWRPSCFGWLLSQEVLDRPDRWETVCQRLLGGRKNLLGIELSHRLSQPLPKDVCFLAGSEALLASSDGTLMPLLVLGKKDDRARQPAEAAGILGWVE